MGDGRDRGQQEGVRPEGPELLARGGDDDDDEGDDREDLAVRRQCVDRGGDGPVEATGAVAVPSAQFEPPVPPEPLRRRTNQKRQAPSANVTSTPAVPAMATESMSFSTPAVP